MDITLYVINGSHPCQTVEAALRLKGLPHRTIELPPPAHALVMLALFGRRTVPAAVVDGEKLSGSRTIVHRLDELVPEPALFPADPVRRAAVEEADAWGDEVLQPLVRRILWPTFRAHPEAMAGMQEGGRLPAIPTPVLKLIAPVATRIAMRMNAASRETYPQDLRALPAMLDRVDAWLAEGVLGGQQANAADLQIGASLALLMCLGDLRPVIAGRPAGRLALRHFPDYPGSVPAGMIPPEYLPAPAA